MMVHANLTLESQSEYWAKAVSCSNFIEDLTIKAGRMEPALAVWTSAPVTKWAKHFVEFGRLAVVNKRTKVSGKMKEKGFAATMVGYAKKWSRHIPFIQSKNNQNHNDPRRIMD